MSRLQNGKSFQVVVSTDFFAVFCPIALIKKGIRRPSIKPLFRHFIKKNNPWRIIIQIYELPNERPAGLGFIMVRGASSVISWPRISRSKQMLTHLFSKAFDPPALSAEAAASYTLSQHNRTSDRN